MTLARFSLRSLIFYWRTNAAVFLGVATAIAVLSGALLVGDSVRGSLADLVLERLGNTSHVVLSTGFFREELGAELRNDPAFDARFDGMTPVLISEGLVSLQTGERRVGRVRVYGVDDRFWEFHGVAGVGGPENRDALFSPGLAEALGVQPGTTILVRVQRPSDIPIESVYGPKDDLGRTLRATLRGIVPTASLGEFSLSPGQGEVQAVFLPLALVQEELEIPGRVNALLLSGNGDEVEATRALEGLVRSRAGLEDLGLKIRTLDPAPTVVLEADDGLLDPAVINAAEAGATAMGLDTTEIFTYLANSLRTGDRQIPYSLVTAIDLDRITGDLPESTASGLPPVVLNAWAAEDLQVEPGAILGIDYFLWDDAVGLVTRSADFELAGVVPVDAGDVDLAPRYPGISDSPTLSDWNPPFPIELSRIRPRDEDYWDLYRTTPKAFIPLDRGRAMWQSRHGALTSVRLEAANPGRDVETEFAEGLGARIDPLGAGLAVAAVRTAGLKASQGAVNFGEYFVYFSFFLVASALLLAALFFKLSVEQRAREIGLLRAVGFTPQSLRRLFLREGLWLSAGAAVVGTLGGVAYAYLIVIALGTWWVDAVGTTALTLHVSPGSLAGGVAGGVGASILCIWATLGQLAQVSERRLLTGEVATESEPSRRRGFLAISITLAAVGGLLIASALAGVLPAAGGFFGAGSALLAACLCLFMFAFGRRGTRSVEGAGWRPVSRLGLRNVTYRPARSVVAIAMIGSATFILISVDAFRREGISETGMTSGVGGYQLVVESLLPIVDDPDTPEGLAALGLDAFGPVQVAAFRLRPGDDASCLNLYEPQNPRIIAPTDAFIQQGRFAFGESLAGNAEERENPWLLLHREEADGAIPVIADANSMTYVLHRSLGEDIVISQGDRTIRLRLVAALDDSIFQGELLMSEANFRNAFPAQQGYRYLLVEAGNPETAPDMADSMEDALLDLGALVTPTTERLAEFHRVENTYLSTFQALGGLGLLLGTIGLGAVLMRNVLERRRELALLRALGYRRRQFFLMVVSENAVLLAIGLLTGLVCAYLAIAPALAGRGAILPGSFLLLLLGSVFGAGLITSVIATIAALSSPLLSALRAE